MIFSSGRTGEYLRCKFLGESRAGKEAADLFRKFRNREEKGEDGLTLRTEYFKKLSAQIENWYLDQIEKTFPVRGYIDPVKLLGSMPPRPEQAAFVEAWPFSSVDTLVFRMTGRSILPKGLLLFGGSGTGKSTAIAKLLSRISREDVGEWDYSHHTITIGDITHENVSGTLAYSAQTLASEISARSRRGGEAFDDLIFALHNCYLLIIDDLDKAGFTDRVCSELFNLLEVRERRSRLTIISTNSTGRALKKRFNPSVGQAILNRLKRTTWQVNFDNKKFNAAESLDELLSDAISRANVLCDGDLSQGEALLEQEIEEMKVEIRAEIPAIIARGVRENVPASTNQRVN